MTSQRAAQILENFPRQSIMVVGDLILDDFIVGRVERISPEAPVPIVRFERGECRIGGAGNVAHNLVALGARSCLVSVRGQDEDGDRLVAQLRASGLETDGIAVDPDRPTTRKLRIVTMRNQHVARVDYENDGDVSTELESTLIAAANRLAKSCSAIVVSDYAKGVVTAGLMTNLVDLSRRCRIPLLVDPKVAHLSYYRGATLVTPNQPEAEAATRTRIRTTDDARTTAADFLRLVGCDGVLITRGEHGMWLLDRGVECEMPAVAREVADVTGAGDTVAATLALSLAAGATTIEGATLANYAAGVVVGKFGPATVTAAELARTMSLDKDLQEST